MGTGFPERLMFLARHTSTAGTNKQQFENSCLAATSPKACKRSKTIRPSRRFFHGLRHKAAEFVCRLQNFGFGVAATTSTILMGFSEILEKQGETGDPAAETGVRKWDAKIAEQCEARANRHRFQAELLAKAAAISANDAETRSENEDDDNGDGGDDHRQLVLDIMTQVEFAKQKLSLLRGSLHEDGGHSGDDVPDGTFFGCQAAWDSYEQSEKHYAAVVAERMKTWFKPTPQDEGMFDAEPGAEPKSILRSDRAFEEKQGLELLRLKSAEILTMKSINRLRSRVAYLRAYKKTLSQLLPAL